jgi:ABC-type amino acid transport substrate-binding protein
VKNNENTISRRDFLKLTGLAVGGATIASSAILAACSGKETTKKDEEITKENLGIVYAGIDGAYPPYCSLNENDQVEGFEVDVMNEIGKRGGITIECAITAWNSMFGQLDSGRIDTVAENLSINADRVAKYDFAGTYTKGGNRFLVQGGKANSISKFEDLAGKKIGVASGSTAYNELEEIKTKYNISFEIVPYDSSTNAYDVSIGRIDASYMSPIVGLSLSKASNLGLELAAVDSYKTTYTGYAFVKNNKRAAFIKDIFEKALKDMYQDGTLKALSEKWFGMDTSYVATIKDIGF